MRSYLHSKSKGLTLVELLVAIAIVGILATLALSHTAGAFEKQRFSELQEAAARLVMQQQTHMQVYGQFATQVNNQGQPNKSTLIISSAADKTISITATSATGFTADIRMKADQPQPNEVCRWLRIVVNKGFVDTSSFSASNADTTTRCVNNV